MKYSFRILTVVMAFAMTQLCDSHAADSQLHKSLQDYFTKSVGKGWIAIPDGSDSRYRPKTMFVYLDDLQKRYEGTAMVKGWVPFSSGLGIYPDDYVTIQREKVTLTSETEDAATKWGLLASVQKALGQLGLDANISATISNEWNIKIQIDEAEKEWIWQDEMLLAQKITERTAQRLTEVMKERYKNVPPIQTVVGALRVRGFSAVAERKANDSAEVKGDLAKLFLQLGLTWNHEKNRYETLKISDWQYVAFQARRAKNGEITINSSAESGESPLDNVYVPASLYVP